MPAQLSGAENQPALLSWASRSHFSMHWFFRSTRWGMHVRAVGDSPAAARAMGISVGARVF